MGSAQSFNPNVTRIVTNTIAQIYLDSTQESSQYLGVNQRFNQDCGNESMQKFVKTCGQTITGKLRDSDGNVDKTLFSKYFKELCTPNNCGTIDGVNMKQIININAQNFANQSVQNQFNNTVKSLIKQNSDIQKAGGISFGKEGNVSETLNSIRNTLSSKTFQSAMLNIAIEQKLEVTGQVFIKNITMKNALDLVRKSMLSNSTIQKSINNLTSQIIQATAAIAKSGFVAIIGWIIRIVLLIVAVILIFFIINLFFQVYIMTVV